MQTWDWRLLRRAGTNMGLTVSRQSRYNMGLAPPGQVWDKLHAFVTGIDEVTTGNNSIRNVT